MKNFLIKLILLILLLSTFKMYAQCDFSNNTVIVSTSGYTATSGYIQEYVLVSTASGNIIKISSNGTFTSISAGTYQVYAINYEGSRPAEVAIGNTWAGVVTYDSNASNCFSASSKYLGRNIEVCAPVVPASQCDFLDGKISVSSSGYTSTAGYTQEYVLVENLSDKIVAINATGTFIGLSNNSFRIYTINYQGTRPGVVAVNSLWLNVNNYDLNASNCFDANDMYLGRAVSVCNTLCNGANLSVSTTGFTATSGYSNYYIAVNSAGKIQANNTTGSFGSLSNGNYSVYAVNTNDATVVSTITTKGNFSTLNTLALTTCTDLLGPNYYSVGINCPLPLSTLKLKGRKTGNYNELTWLSDNDFAKRNYSLQRSADSKTDFETIINYSNELLTGNYTDKAPFANTYYRIAYFSDNRIVYSETINIENLKELNDIVVFPNPAKDKITIKFNTIKEETITIELISALGVTIKYENITSNIGNNTIDFNFGNLCSGIYFLKINTIDENYIQKLMVKE